MLERLTDQPLDTHQHVVDWMKEVSRMFAENLFVCNSCGREAHNDDLKLLMTCLEKLGERMKIRDQMDPVKTASHQFTAELALQAARRLTNEQAMEILRSRDYTLAYEAIERTRERQLEDQEKEKRKRLKKQEAGQLAAQIRKEERLERREIEIEAELRRREAVAAGSSVVDRGTAASGSSDEGSIPSPPPDEEEDPNKTAINEEIAQLKQAVKKAARGKKNV